MDSVDNDNKIDKAQTIELAFAKKVKESRKIEHSVLSIMYEKQQQKQKEADEEMMRGYP